MSKGQLFEYAVLYHPKATKEQNDRNEQLKSVVVVPLTTVMAGAQQEVQITAGRAIPAEHLDHLDDVEILIRSFLE